MNRWSFYSIGAAIELACLLVLLLCLPDQLRAQTAAATDSIPGPTFFLSLDAYYRVSDPEGATLTSPSLVSNEINLGWLSAGARHEWGKAGVSGLIAFGPRGQQFYGGPDEGVSGFIREAFAYLLLTPDLKVSAGLFPAFYGYEADDPFLNEHYSNSYAYSLAPACPSGIQLKWTISERWGLLLGRYNEVASRFTIDGRSVYGGSLTYANGEEKKAALSFLSGQTVGDQQILAFNLTAGIPLARQWAVGTELQYHPFRNPGEARTNYSSAALYLKYDSAKNWYCAFRGEYFSDRGGFGFEPETGIRAFTLTAAKIIGLMKAFAEVRTDNANVALFAGGGKTETSALVGFSYLLEQ